MPTPGKKRLSHTKKTQGRILEDEAEAELRRNECLFCLTSFYDEQDNECIPGDEL